MREWGIAVCVACAVTGFFAVPSAPAQDDLVVAQAGPGPRPGGPGGPGGPGARRGGPGRQRDADENALTPSAVPWSDVQVHLRSGPGRNFDGAIAAALERTASLNRKMLVLVPQPFPFEGANPNAHDYDVFLNAVRRNPDTLAFLGGARLNALLQATEPTAATDDVKRRFVAEANKVLDDGARGFGELAILHFSEFPGHPFESIQPDHPLLLVLSDLAAERNAVIAVHIEAVDRDMALPSMLASPPNPPRLSENITAFERLLSHNPKARIVWLHNGWDNTGRRTPELVGRLLEAHPNLYLSLKFHRARFPSNGVVVGQGLNADWIAVLRQFPDRAVIGSDSFFAAAVGQAAGTVYEPEPMLTLLSRLQQPLLENVAHRNAERLYNLAR